MPSLEHGLILVAGGAVAGFINTLAGGGSFLTVPLLILLGLPPTVANATNRVAIFAQNWAAVAGFRQEGISGLERGLRLLPATLPGAWLGAWIASSVPEEVFEFAFALMMLAALPFILRNPKPRPDGAGAGLGWPLQFALYFAMGLYAGAIQAGIGIPLLFALVLGGGLDLVRANSVKVAIIAAMTTVALAQFTFADKVEWGYGIVLGLGSALGGYVASRAGARVGERLIRAVLALLVPLLALRLLLV